MGKKQLKASSSVIAHNRKARHDYQIESTVQAGLVLLGWELKSIRANRVQLKESYIVFRDQEAWLIGAHISPLTEACTHNIANPMRERKLLLSRDELRRFQAKVTQKGMTLVVLDMHWKQQRVKLSVALAQGKKLYDKRRALKEQQVKRESDQARRALGR